MNNKTLETETLNSIYTKHYRHQHSIQETTDKIKSVHNAIIYLTSFYYLPKTPSAEEKCRVKFKTALKNTLDEYAMLYDDWFHGIFAASEIMIRYSRSARMLPNSLLASFSIEYSRHNLQFYSPKNFQKNFPQTNKWRNDIDVIPFAIAFGYDEVVKKNKGDEYFINHVLEQEGFDLQRKGDASESRILRLIPHNMIKTENGLISSVIEYGCLMSKNIRVSDENWRRNLSTIKSELIKQTPSDSIIDCSSALMNFSYRLRKELKLDILDESAMQLALENIRYQK